eukprot:TRINITY_DN1715_c0_g1_i11.p2 TRINITY_DN1715_c0_g1~~TRINITY_DN1715_c0_g1_i11.p2  ORF type:complete len:247 (+),score=27.72 TRINITY_DN1715_c0_g1_i11:97-837(+)
MSASPVVGVKRRPSEGGSQTCLRKRSCLQSKNVDICHGSTPFVGEQGAFKNIYSELQVLGALFPGMSHQKIQEVYKGTDQDVQAAIRILNQLTLQEVQQGDSQPEQEQDENEEGKSGYSKLADQLVDVGMQRLQTATSFDDGKYKLSSLLHQLESMKEQQFTHVATLMKDKIKETKYQNSILKRAVQIQNSRMQEIAQREGSLQQQLVHSQQKIRELELKNYTLTMHLESAIKNQNQNGFHPPDVF